MYFVAGTWLSFHAGSHHINDVNPTLYIQGPLVAARSLTQCHQIIN